MMWNSRKLLTRESWKIFGKNGNPAPGFGEQESTVKTHTIKITFCFILYITSFAINMAEKTAKVFIFWHCLGKKKSFYILYIALLQYINDIQFWINGVHQYYPLFPLLSHLHSNWVLFPSLQLTPSFSRSLHPTPSSYLSLHPTPSSSLSLHPTPSSSLSLHLTPSSSLYLHPTPSSNLSLHPTPSSSLSLHHTPSSSLSLHLTPSSSLSLHPSPTSSLSLHPTPSSSLSLHPNELGVLGGRGGWGGGSHPLSRPPACGQMYC